MRYFLMIAAIMFFCANFLLPSHPLSNAAAFRASADPTVTEPEIGSVSNAGDFATKLMQWAQPVIASLAVVMLIVAGYFYVTSQGNPEGIKSAKEIIIGVVSGLALLYLATLLFNTIGVNPAPASPTPSVSATPSHTPTPTPTPPHP